MDKVKKSGLRKRLFAYALAAAMAFLHMTLLSHFGTATLEPFALEAFFAARGPVEPPGDVEIVAIDETTYRELGLSPIVPVPRRVLADLLVRLKQYGVKRVALDLLFSGPSSDAAGDQAFADALALNETILFSRSKNGSENIFPLFSSRAKSASGLLILDGGVVRRFDDGGNGSADESPTLSEAAAGFDEGDIHPPSAQDFISYYGPGGTIPTVSLYSVLSGGPEIEKQLKGKIIFVGLAMPVGSAAAPVDKFITSFKRDWLYGAEVHATISANLIGKDWIRRLSPQLESALFNSLILILVLAIALVRPPAGFAIWAGSSILWVSSSYFAFLHGVFIPCVSGVGIVLPLAFLMTALFYYTVVARDERRLRSALSLYLAPQMVSEVLRKKETLELGGEEREIAILFSDIEGYTAWSESLPPLEVTRHLKTYFTASADAVMETGGTLVKFIGDSVFAIWGAPLAMQDSMERAMLGVLRMQKRLKKLIDEGKMPPLKTRYGLNFGTAVVGNTGSSTRFDYTASGDAVNLAARLERLNKQFGISILISDGARRELKGRFPLLELGRVTLYGRTQTTTVHAVIEDPPESWVLKAWEDGLRHFQKREWDLAEEEFSKIVSARPLDKAVEVYMTTLRQYRQNPPSSSWEGEIVLLEK